MKKGRVGGEGGKTEAHKRGAHTQELGDSPMPRSSEDFAPMGKKQGSDILTPCPCTV